MVFATTLSVLITSVKFCKRSAERRVAFLVNVGGCEGYDGVLWPGLETWLDRGYVVREHVPQPFDMTRPLRQVAGRARMWPELKAREHQ